MTAPDSGRACGTCTLCCKLPAIAELSKPAGSWCHFCAPQSGCTVYADRPKVCRDFRCGWLAEASYPDHWKPSACKMILVTQPGGQRLNVHVDPDRPDAWQREPFLSDLVAWARDLVPQGISVVVQAPPRLIGILPGGPQDLGQLAAGGEVVLDRRQRPDGVVWRYRRVPLAGEFGN